MPMKHVTLLPLVMLGMFFLPTVAIAETYFWDGFQEANQTATQEAGLKDDQKIAPVIQRAINWLLGLIGVIAVVAIIYAGVRLITGRGEESQMEKAKATLLWAVAGLLIVIFAWVILTVVTDQFLVDQRFI